MTKKFAHLVSSAVILLFIALGLACATGKNAHISKAGGEIPPEFGSNTDTLLVVKNKPEGIGTGTVFRSAFKKYNNPCLLINEKEVKNYSKDRYRYILYVGQVASNFHYSNGMSGPGTATVIIEDRQTGKQYTSANSVPDWGHLLKSYVKAMNDNK